MDELKLANLLLTVTHNDREQIEGTIMPTPACPPLPRLLAAVLGENWTKTEEKHKKCCTYCQRTADRVQTAAWHPALVELFAYTRGRQGDVAYHLERDDCKHCHRLREALADNRLVRRLAAKGDDGRLNEFLRSGVVGKVVEVNGGKETRLVQVVVGRSEHLVLLRSGEMARFSGHVVMVFDVRAGVLAVDDLAALRDAGKKREGVWNEWTAQALRGAELDGKVRDALAQWAAPRKIGR
jgi:hypothetical protein